MSFFRAKGEIFEDAQANLLLKNEKSKDCSKADHDNNNISADHFRILISKPFQSLRGRSYMYIQTYEGLNGVVAFTVIG